MRPARFAKQDDSQTLLSRSTTSVFPITSSSSTYTCLFRRSSGRDLRQRVLQASPITSPSKLQVLHPRKCGVCVTSARDFQVEPAEDRAKLLASHLQVAETNLFLVNSRVKVNNQTHKRTTPTAFDSLNSFFCSSH